MGSMGIPVVENLLSAGYSLCVYTRTPQ
ncbi:NAD(P)-binding domain-containing protein [Thermicanus aegyptius]